MNIGTSLKFGLGRENLKNKELAHDIGTSESYVSAICNNKKVPSVQRIEFFANYFKVKVSTFISWGEPN